MKFLYCWCPRDHTYKEYADFDKRSMRGTPCEDLRRELSAPTLGMYTYAEASL